MDTQDKIIINKSGKEEIYYFKNISKNETLFSFKEFEKVKIELKGDENNFIEFEYPNNDQLMKLYSNQSIILNDYEYDRDSTDNNTFYPSKYYISINYNKNKIECYFNVESNALGNNIEDIREIVSNFSNGLELDLFNNNRGKEFVDTNESYYIPLYDKIVSSEKMLQFEINYIINHPIENLEKDFKLTRKAAKITKKQARYEIKKGINLYSGKKTIQVSNSLNLKNHENYSLKKSVNKIINLCSFINKHFETLITKFDNLLINEYNQLEEITKKKNSLNTRRHDQKYQKRIYSEYSQLTDIIHKHSTKKLNLIEKHNTINKIRNNFLSLVTESWLRELDDKNHLYEYPKHIKNVHYKKIIDFAKNLNVNFDDYAQKKGKYAYKKTSKLYEIYVLILVFKIFESNGYKFEFDSEYDLNFLFESQEYFFIKDNKTIRVIYDKTIKGTDENPKDELSNQNSTSNKPDIVIMIYENGLIKDCIILEVKCRRKNNIYTKTGETPVISQLKDYTNFWYFDSEGNLDKNILKKVYAIFPQETPYIKNLNANQICLLALKPIYNFENDISYLNLFNEITSYI